MSTPSKRAHDPIGALILRLTIVTVGVLLLAAGTASWLSLRSFDPLVQPELARKAQTVGELLATQINRGLSVRIPLERMPGLDALLKEEEARHADIAYLAISDSTGRLIASSGAVLAGVSVVATDRLTGGDDDRLVSGFIDIARPLGAADQPAGRMHVGVDRAYLAKASTNLMLDVLSVVIVAVLLIFEILQLVVNLAMRRALALRMIAERAEDGDFRADLPSDGGDKTAAADSAEARGLLDGVNARYAALASRVAELARRFGPDDPRVAQAQAGLAALTARFRFRDPNRKPGAGPEPSPLNLVFLRLPVFLFCFSEELSHPFLPAYAMSFANDAPWLSPDMVVSLPITLFMLMWAISQPGGARFSEQMGRSRAFLIGALLGSIGLAMSAFASSLLALIVWRCVTALGYGLVLITAQGIVIDHTGPRNRAGGMAMFIGALLAAGVCGPVSGGMIADLAGFRVTFLLGAGLALVSGLSVWGLLLRGRSSPERAGPPRSILSGALPLCRDFRFPVLMLLSAIPTKIAATAFLFCLIPLLLSADGASKAEIGRVQMMYFVACILVSPLAATLSDRWQTRRGFVALGGIGTLFSCVPIVATDAMWGPPLAIALFGVAQSMIASPQFTMVSQIAREGGLPETAAIGWYRLIERLGGAIGPVVAMAIAAATSYRDAMLGIGVLCGGSALLFWVLYNVRKRPVARPQEA